MNASSKSRLSVLLLAASLVGLGACAGASRGEEAVARDADPSSNIQVGYTATLPELEAAQAAGFDYIELRVTEIAPLSDAEFEQLYQRIKRLKIPTPVANYFVPGSIKVTGPNTDEAKQMAYVNGALDRMKRLGVEYIVFGSSGARNYPKDFPKEEAYAQLVDFCKRVAPEAQRRGITILIEPLRTQESNIVNTVRDGYELVKAVDHPNFQLMADFYHIAYNHEDPEIVVEARDRIHHLHMANPVGRVFPLSWTEYDYAPFFAALRRSGYHGRISIEATTKDMENDGPKSIRLMREAFDPAFALKPWQGGAIPLP
jgi:sugar phosphate isomerase/epimerase